MIRAITFDFWRTLFRDANGEPRQRIRSDAFIAATGVPGDALEAAMKRCWAEFDRCHREEQRTLEPEDAVRMIARTMSVDLPANVASDLAEVFATAILHHSPEPIEGALDAVKAAAALLPVGIISDAGVSPGRSLYTLLERHGFTPYIRGAVFSDDLRVSKPQRPMFETAAAKLGVRPEELLHIGDLEYTDIVGAKAVGAQAALFTADNPRHAQNTTADYVFSSWAEFIDTLPTLISRG